MKLVLATLAALVFASPAVAGYHFVTIDGPASPALLGTVVTGINDGGVATGYFVTADPTAPPGALGDYTAFTVNADGSGFTAFSRPGYAQTGASGINNAGDITGVSVTAADAGTGYVRSGTTGTYADILPPFAGAYYSEAIGINNTGAVTGYYVTDPAATVATLSQYAHGFVDFGGTYLPVDVDPTVGHGRRSRRSTTSASSPAAISPTVPALASRSSASSIRRAAASISPPSPAASARRRRRSATSPTIC